LPSVLLVGWPVISLSLPQFLFDSISDPLVSAGPRRRGRGLELLHEGKLLEEVADPAPDLPGDCATVIGALIRGVFPPVTVLPNQIGIPDQAAGLGGLAIGARETGEAILDDGLLPTPIAV
jgi:hypothetical protein